MTKELSEAQAVLAKWTATDIALPPVDAEVLTVERDFVVSRTWMGPIESDWRFTGYAHPVTGATHPPIFTHWRLTNSEGERPTIEEATALRLALTQPGETRQGETDEPKEEDA